MKRTLLLVTLAALAAPGLARGGDVALQVRNVALGPRALQTAGAPMHFNMLAVHWKGPGGVVFRTRSLRGRWSSWTQADADDSQGARVRVGALVWTGASARAQFRVRGRVSGLKAYYLWSRVTTRPTRALATAGSPAIVPRASWFADESIRRAKPRYAPTLRLAVVHHTAGTNSYSPAQAAAIVRGIEVYHVKGNGWDDIGYNFLVDRYGTVYEGRSGGIERNVVGAHALGFNNGTVGVALIGNFSASTPPPAQQAALVKLLAWRLDVAHVDPTSSVVYTSGGNAKFRAGKIVTLRAISGHRDTGPSECPGNVAYSLLPQLTQQVARTGLPKLFSPTVSGVLGGSVRFQARLSSILPWAVTVVDASGAVVAKGTGRSAIVDWTWVSTGVNPRGAFRWTIEAGSAVRPASGVFGTARGVVAPVTPTLVNVLATPSVITPNADGTGDTTTVSFTLGAPALVSLQVLDASRAPLLALETAQRAAGPNSFVWGAHVLPDGRYTFVVTARPSGGKAVTVSVPIVVDRTLAGLVASSTAMSPNGDGVFDVTTFSFQLAQNVPVRVDVYSADRGAAPLATPFNGQLGVGPHVLDWDGKVAGVRVPDGAYVVVVTVTDQLGNVSLSLPVAVDTTPPTLTLLDPKTLRFQLSEPATVNVLVNGTQRIQKTAPKGTFTVAAAGPVTSVSAQAQDAAGNVSAIVTSP